MPWGLNKLSFTALSVKVRITNGVTRRIDTGLELWAWAGKSRRTPLQLDVWCKLIGGWVSWIEIPREKEVPVLAVTRFVVKVVIFLTGREKQCNIEHLLENHIYIFAGLVSS